MDCSTTNISIRMDSDLKMKADKLFWRSWHEYITAFIRQSLREGYIPSEPDKKTTAAMLEAERIAKDPQAKGYNDLDELFADMKS